MQGEEVESQMKLCKIGDIVISWKDTFAIIKKITEGTSNKCCIEVETIPNKRFLGNRTPQGTKKHPGPDALHWYTMPVHDTVTPLKELPSPGMFIPYPESYEKPIKPAYVSRVLLLDNEGHCKVNDLHYRKWDGTPRIDVSTGL